MIAFQVVYLGRTEKLDADTGCIKLDLKPYGTAVVDVTSNVMSYNFPHHKSSVHAEYARCSGEVLHNVLSDLFGERGVGTSDTPSLTASIYEREHDQRYVLRYIVVNNNPDANACGEVDVYDVQSGGVTRLRYCDDEVTVGYYLGTALYAATSEGLYIKYPNGGKELVV